MRISDWSSDVCSSDLRVGRRAVQRFGRERRFAEFGGDIGIVEVAERRAGVAVRQEEVPQARGLRLVLCAFEQFELPRRPAPAIGAGFAQPEEFFGDRIDIVGDMALDGVEERLRFLRHAQVVERSEAHTSDIQSLMRISYAVFCLKKTKILFQYIRISIVYS